MVRTHSDTLAIFSYQDNKVEKILLRSFATRRAVNKDIPRLEVFSRNTMHMQCAHVYISSSGPVGKYCGVSKQVHEFFYSGK